MNPVSGRKFVLTLGAVALTLGSIAYFSVAKFHEANRLRDEEQARWPKVRAMRGGEMVLVPSGVFLAGQTKEAVNTPAFYIDRNRVTSEALKEFRADAGPPSANDARAFCAWAGKRLPYSVEWEKAARLESAEGMYGHGWEWIDDQRRAGTEDIAAFTKLHTLDPPLQPSERWTRVRGGTPPADTFMFPARFRSPEIGFRCVYLPPQ